MDEIDIVCEYLKSLNWGFAVRVWENGKGHFIQFSSDWNFDNDNTVGLKLINGQLKSGLCNLTIELANPDRTEAIRIKNCLKHNIDCQKKEGAGYVQCPRISPE